MMTTMITTTTTAKLLSSSSLFSYRRPCCRSLWCIPTSLSSVSSSSPSSHYGWSSTLDIDEKRKGKRRRVEKEGESERRMSFNYTRRYYNSNSNISDSNSNTNDDEQHDYVVLKLIQNLSRRLQEPIPLRVSSSPSSSSSSHGRGRASVHKGQLGGGRDKDDDNEGGSRQKKSRERRTQQRLAELAHEVCSEYVSLEPLRLFHHHHHDNTNINSWCCERSQILYFLAAECHPSESDVNRIIDIYLMRQQKKQQQGVVRTTNTDLYDRLRKVTTPTYELLIDFVLQQSTAVSGIEFIIKLREDLLSIIAYYNNNNNSNVISSTAQQQQQQQQQQQLKLEFNKQRIKQYKNLDTYLRSVLTAGFGGTGSDGLLQHQRITYEDTPASVIEYIAKNEQVHPIQNLDDLRSRFNQTTRRVYGLFHPYLLPNIPLVFVHVALLSSSLSSSPSEYYGMDGIINNNNRNRKIKNKVVFVPSSMNDILGSSMSSSSSSLSLPHYYDVATFYSISNGVKGLTGVGLGEFLIKESVKAIQNENAATTTNPKTTNTIQTFVTLSPVPKFRNWLKVKLLKLEQQKQRKTHTIVGGDNSSSNTSKSNNNTDNDVTEDIAFDDDDTVLSAKDREELFRCGLLQKQPQQNLSLSSSSHLSISVFPWKVFWETLETMDFTKLHQQQQDTEHQMLENKTYDTNPATDEEVVSGSKNDDNDDDEVEQKQQQQQYDTVKNILCKLVARYLVIEKYRGKPIDKVLGFHVGNGAELYDIHFGADVSRRGLSNSYGIMVNYLYPVSSLSMSKMKKNTHNNDHDHQNINTEAENNTYIIVDQIQENQTQYECYNIIPISTNIQRWL